MIEARVANHNMTSAATPGTNVDAGAQPIGELALETFHVPIRFPRPRNARSLECNPYELLGLTHGKPERGYAIGNLDLSCAVER